MGCRRRERSSSSLYRCAAHATVLALAAATLSAQTAAEIGGCSDPAANVVAANPGNYQALLDTLGPGDRLELAPGTYDNGSLILTGYHGLPGACITIAGPAVFPPVVTIRASASGCCDTVEIRDSSYLALRHLEIDSRSLPGVAGIHAKGTDPVHHVTVAGSRFVGQDSGQQTVGISTKTEAWNWVIRRNHIAGAGTGIYLGNSNGDDEFVRGLIEHNVVVDTIGYNMQVKHQNARAAGMPAAGTTIIRHNVFSKANNASVGGDARPNLLVGHWPLSGTGSNDTYLIYGNFFYDNPTGEALLQGEGNIALYANLFANPNGSAVAIQQHNDVPREVHVLQNTVVATGQGIRISNADAGFDQEVIGNAVFAATPLQGGTSNNNVTGTYGDAATALVSPYGAPQRRHPWRGPTPLDLYPQPNQLDGAVYSLSLTPAQAAAFSDHGADFDFSPRGNLFRGAYTGAGVGAGWLPQLDFKPEPALFADGFENGGVLGWSTAQP